MLKNRTLPECNYKAIFHNGKTNITANHVLNDLARTLIGSLVGLTLTLVVDR
jgi:hypothetical protein